MFARIPHLSKWSLAIVISLGAVSTMHAQDNRSTQVAVGSANASSPRAKLERIHEVAKQATNINEFTDSLRQCKAVYESRISSTDRDYLRKLSSWLYVRRGEAYGQAAVDADAQGDPQTARTYELQAKKDFTAAIELAPNWRAYHNRGVSYAILSNFEAALADFDEAIKSNKQQHASSFFNRAEVLYELSRLEEAERDYTRALIADPTDAQAAIGRAHVKFELQRPGEALRDFDEAISIDPENAIAYADRGDLNASVGNWKAAAKDFKTAIQLDRSLGRAYQSAAWLMATCPDPTIQNPDLALRAAKRAIDLDGKSDYRYLDTVAAALASAEEYERAVDALRQAMQQAPTEVLPELEQRLAEYRAGRPFRDVQTR